MALRCLTCGATNSVDIVSNVLPGHLLNFLLLFRQSPEDPSALQRLGVGTEGRGKGGNESLRTGGVLAFADVLPGDLLLEGNATQLALPALIPALSSR